jgi:hypothetical protein
MQPTSTTTPSTARVALKAGLITGLAMTVYSTVLSLAGLPQTSPLHYITFLLLVGGLVYGMRDFKEQNGGYMTYGQGLGVGTLASAVAGLLSSLISTFYVKFVDPTLLQRTMDEQRIQMEERGMSDAQIDQAMKIAESMSGFSFIIATIGVVFFGFILSLIIAAFVKRERDVLDV